MIEEAETIEQNASHMSYTLVIYRACSMQTMTIIEGRKTCPEVYAKCDTLNYHEMVSK